MGSLRDGDRLVRIGPASRRRLAGHGESAPPARAGGAPS